MKLTLQEIDQIIGWWNGDFKGTAKLYRALQRYRWSLLRKEKGLNQNKKRRRYGKRN